MSPEEIQAMAKGMAEGQAIWYLCSAVIGGAITGCSAYLAEKFKNRATKEDIGKITREVEEARKDFNRQLEDLKAHHQLRLVAAEKRLQVLQEAYSEWQKLFQAVVTKKKPDVEEQIEAYKIWFHQNCIFLGRESGAAIQQAMVASLNYFAFQNRMDITGDVYIENWLRLEGAANVFLKEADLPPLTKQDLESMKKEIEDSPV